MAPGTFDRFSYLPFEVRECIWDMAIRPNRPGAHIFTLYNQESENAAHVRASKVIQQDEKYWDFEQGWALATPTDSGLGECSWLTDNCSTYLVDSGLWTACKESREAMLRRFRPDFWAPQRREYLSTTNWMDDHDKAPNAPVGGYFGAEDDKRWLTIYPKSDLIILRPFCDDWSFTFRTLVVSLPLLGPSGGSCANHIAFEPGPSFFCPDRAAYFQQAIKYYHNPEQYVREHGAAPKKHDNCRCWDNRQFTGLLKDVVGRGQWGERVAPFVWIVDNNAKRVSSPSPPGPESRHIFYGRLPPLTEAEETAPRHVFYGNGCRYVECREDDTEWSYNRDLLDEIVKCAEYCVESCWGRRICLCDRNTRGGSCCCTLPPPLLYPRFRTDIKLGVLARVPLDET